MRSVCDVHLWCGDTYLTSFADDFAFTEIQRTKEDVLKKISDQIPMLASHSVDVSNFGRKKCDSVLTLDLSSMHPKDSGNMPQTFGEQWLFEI